MDNMLDYMDQASFLGLRALGHGPVIQLTWIYEHRVDLDALRRFQRNLGRGLLGRRVERSPLPFGRHRWLAWPGPTDLDVATSAVPRGAVHRWFDEQAALPIDPEHGPSWRLAVAPTVEGGAAVSLVLSHTVADGVGAALSVTDAANGAGRDLGYPASARPRKVAAALADSRQLIRDLPAMGRAVMALPRLARGRGDAISGSVRETRAEHRGPNRPVTPATITLYAECEQWDRRAAELGGTPTSLFIGLSCRLGGRLDWVGERGLVEISVPVNERTEGDTRGNALTQVSLTVDPNRVAHDLSGIRADLKAALADRGVARHDLLAPLPLVPLIPKAVARRLEGVIISTGVIGSSNLGEFDPAVNRPDGTDADYFAVRLAENLTLSDIRRSGGSFFPVVTGRVNGKIFVSIGYTNADNTTTREQVIERVQRTLDDFALTAHIE